MNRWRRLLLLMGALLLLLAGAGAAAPMAEGSEVDEEEAFLSTGRSCTLRTALHPDAAVRTAAANLEPAPRRRAIPQPRATSPAPKPVRLLIHRFNE
jgi:hypothetical protein